MHNQYDYLFNPLFDPNPSDNGQQTLDGEPTPASLEMEIDSFAMNITGWDNESSQKAMPPQLSNYSPSLPQGDATNSSLAQC
jgi:hypothetical protein